MDLAEIQKTLKTVGTIVGMVSPVAGAAIGTLGAIGSLIELATSAKATFDDGKRTWDLIQGHVDGSVVLADLEAEIEALEARGLKPIAPEEN